MGNKELVRHVINIASKVYRTLGSGLFQNVYEDCLIHELSKHNIKVEKQKHMPLKYDGMEFKQAFKVDILVEDKLVVGIKPIDIKENIYIKHIETYTRLCGSNTGIILDFNINDFSAGVRIIEKEIQKPVVPPMAYAGYYYNKKR